MNDCHFPEPVRVASLLTFRVISIHYDKQSISLSGLMETDDSDGSTAPCCVAVISVCGLMLSMPSAASIMLT